MSKNTKKGEVLNHDEILRYFDNLEEDCDDDDEEYLSFESSGDEIRH